MWIDPLVVGNKSVLVFRRRLDSGSFDPGAPASFFHYLNKVNRAAWMRKERRSCMFAATVSPGDGSPEETLLVGYRPRGWVTRGGLAGTPRLDGWWAEDGSGGDGAAAGGLGRGWQPEEADFDRFDFREFLGEADGRVYRTPPRPSD